MTSGFDARIRETAVRAHIRDIQAKDRSPIEGFLRRSEQFTSEEAATAIEVIDEALGGDPDYTVKVLEDAAGSVVGYECHGPTPLTDGTFDLYWIAVDPRAQRSGYGATLLRAAEDDVKKRGGRLLVIETSSQASYDRTIQFYKRNGYQLEARIRDFYRPGDDKLMFVKSLR